MERNLHGESYKWRFVCICLCVWPREPYLPESKCRHWRVPEIVRGVLCDTHQFCPLGASACAGTAPLGGVRTMRKGGGKGESTHPFVANSQILDHETGSGKRRGRGGNNTGVCNYRVNSVAGEGGKGAAPISFAARRTDGVSTGSWRKCRHDNRESCRGMGRKKNVEGGRGEDGTETKVR